MTDLFIEYLYFAISSNDIINAKPHDEIYSVGRHVSFDI